MTKIQNGFDHSNLKFEIVSNFEIRISSLKFFMTKEPQYYEISTS